MPNLNTPDFLGPGLSAAAHRQLDFARAADRESAPEARAIYENLDAVLRQRLQHLREFYAQFPKLPAEHPLATFMEATVTKITASLSYGEVQIAYCNALLADRVDELHTLEAAAGHARSTMERARVTCREQHDVWRAYLAEPQDRNVGLQRPVRARRCSAPTSDGREQIRRQSPGQRRGPPEPDPDRLLKLLDQFESQRVSLNVALREQIAAISREYRWFSQRDDRIPRRLFCKLARDLGDRGDPRARRQGKLYLVRSDAVEEYMRGLPQPRSAASAMAPAPRISTGERLELEFRARGLIQ
jgi:hypothetical protein